MEILKMDEKKSLLSVDIENCFNSMDRKDTLKLIADKLPNLYNLIYSLYCNKSVIVLDNGTKLYLENGFYQGRITSTVVLAVIQNEIEKQIETKCKEIYKQYFVDAQSFYRW